MKLKRFPGNAAVPRGREARSLETFLRSNGMTRRISYRYRNVLFALIMSCTTSMIVSAIIIYLHGPSQNGFMKIWLSAFATAWPIVFLAILVIAPLVNKLLDRVVSNKAENG
jgi:hypothetical protein